MGALFLFFHGPGWARASDVAGAAGAAGAAWLAQLAVRLGLFALLFRLGTASLQPTCVFRAQGLGKVLLLGPLPKVRPKEEEQQRREKRDYSRSRRKEAASSWFRDGAARCLSSRSLPGLF